MLNLKYWVEKGSGWWRGRVLWSDQELVKVRGRGWCWSGQGEGLVCHGVHSSASKL